MPKSVKTTLFEKLFNEMQSLGLIVSNKRFVNDCSLVSHGFMNLVIENLNGAYRDESGRSQAVYMMCHYYAQLGDNMYDPCVEFGIDFRNGMVYPLVMKSDSVRIHLDTWITGELDLSAEKEIGLFLTKWLKNLKSQGFMKDLKKAV